MKLCILTASLALSSHAIVIPDEQVLRELAVEDSQLEIPSTHQGFSAVEHASEGLFENVKNVLSGAVAAGERAKGLFDHILEASTSAQQTWDETFDAQGWLESGVSEEPPHHGPPHHSHPGPPGEAPPHERPGRRPPHHGPPKHHPHKSNKTVYELIAESKYTTKLAKLIGEFDDLVELLNGTSANFTVFAPTDAAFKKIPKHAPKPSKEFLKKILTYHVSPFFYPAGRVLYSDTIPTAYNESALGDEPQRLSVRVGLKGLLVNFYSKIVATNIFASNGVIHGIDSLLLPPPKAFTILNFLPAEFSTLLLALEKTGLGATLNDTSLHEGGTLFAPGNFAFKKLGPGPNAFLFSPHGLKYLKALLKYHIAANQTLYSDAFYSSSAEEQDNIDAARPKKSFHFDLPTLLDDRSLPVDITRFGPFISVRVNGRSRVTVKNGIAKDGVIHAVSNVLIPPKQASEKDEEENWDGEELTVEDLKERLDPFVEAEESSELEQIEPGNHNLKWEM